MILLQIVMVSPGTRLVKIKSPSPEPMSPGKKKNESEIENAKLGVYVTINLKTSP